MTDDARSSLLRRLIRGLWPKRAFERELEEEIQIHLAMEAADAERCGMARRGSRCRSTTLKELEDKSMEPREVERVPCAFDPRPQGGRA